MGIDKCISPQIVKRQRKAGKNIDLTFDLLPGYVFIYSDKEIKDVSQLKVQGVIRILGSNNAGYCLEGNDYTFALGLLERGGVIDVMRVLRTGDTVSVDDTLFDGCNGRIIKIDYRKQRANVEFLFAGINYHSWVACDVINIADDV